MKKIIIHQGEALKNAFQESGLSISDFATKYGLHRNSLRQTTFDKRRLSTQMLNTLRSNGFNMQMLEVPYDTLLSDYIKLDSDYNILLSTLEQLTAYNTMLKDKVDKLVKT